MSDTLWQRFDSGVDHRQSQKSSGEKFKQEKFSRRNNHFKYNMKDEEGKKEQGLLKKKYQ